MKLTTNFRSEEFGHDMSQSIKNNYYLLCLLVLEKVRERFGVVQITSGYRSDLDQERLRKEGKNPSNTSQHLFGEAADFICPYAHSMGEVFRFILDEIKWPGETILYPRRGHIHVALPQLGVHADQFIKEGE